MIRPATKSDVPRLVEIGQEFFNMTELDNVTTYNLESVTNLLSNSIDDESSTVLVVELDGEIVGATGATIYPFYFNTDNRVAQEFFWYIAETHRGGLIGVKLFKALEMWALENGAQTMDMTALGVNQRSVGQFYEKQGYYRQETHYMRRL